MIKLKDLIIEKKKKYIKDLSPEQFKVYRKAAMLKSSGKITQQKFDSVVKKLLGEGKLTEASAYKTATRNELAMYITQLSNTINGTKDRKMLQYLKKTKKEVSDELKSRKKVKESSIHKWDKALFIKKGMMVWFQDSKGSAKKLKVKHIMKSSDGKEEHYVTGKGTFTADDVVGY